MGWLTADALRAAAGAKQPSDQARIELAAAGASRKARELCGPVTPVETITDRVRVRRPVEEVALTYRPAALTSITKTRSGVVLDVSDFETDGQLLLRTDGDWIEDDLTVVYTAGYATLDDVPDEIVALGLMIGQQLLRVTKRFGIDSAEIAGAGFLVPTAASELASDYLLAPGGL